MSRITLKQAIKLADDFYKVDPEKAGRSVYKKSYLYNLISKKKLKNYGPRHMVLLDEQEFRRKLLVK